MHTDDQEIPGNDNDLTLQSYQNQTQAYTDGTPGLDDTLRRWIDECLKLVPANARILEIGSGFGRDAEYFRERGFDIECSDAVPNFVAMLKTKGFEARELNVLKEPIDDTYDMIFADAVLLHFTPEEAIQVMQNVYNALEDNGVFALSMKKGNGAVWTNEKLGEPRYFYYWQPEELKAALATIGFTWLGVSESYTSHNNADWMRIIARKAT